VGIRIGRMRVNLGWKVGSHILVALRMIWKSIQKTEKLYKVTLVMLKVTVPQKCRDANSFAFVVTDFIEERARSTDSFLVDSTCK